MKTNNEEKSFGGFDLNSKFWRIFLIILSALLIFVGPTYVPYVLANILKLNYAASIIFGFALLITGFVLMWYLIRKKIIG